MPQRKRKVIAKRKNVTQKKDTSVKKSNGGFLKSIKFGESYTSLLLGVVVVVVAVLFAVSIIKQTRSNNNHQPTQATSSISTTPSIVLSQAIELTPTEKNPTLAPTQMQAEPIQGSRYTVQSGDDLWHIAEKFYKSGHNWVDLAKANHLENPGVLFAGTVLIIPSIAPKLATVPTQVQPQAPPISSGTYMVQSGDDLWNVAVRAYGDGYRWTDIAKANSLSNPSIIHSGNVLKIPRP